MCFTAVQQIQHVWNCFKKIYIYFHSWFFPQQGNIPDPKKKRKSERLIAGSVSGKKTKPGETGRGRNEGNRLELIHAERGEHDPGKAQHIRLAHINSATEVFILSMINYV